MSHSDQFQEPGKFRSVQLMPGFESEQQTDHHSKGLDDVYGEQRHGLQKDTGSGWGLAPLEDRLIKPVQDQPLSDPFGPRPSTIDFEEDFAIEHDFPSFDDLGGSIDVSQSSLFPQIHDDPDSPPLLPSFFIRPSCYVCQLDGRTAIEEVEKVMRKKHFDVRKPDKWTLACMAYKDMDEISFAVQVWSTDVHPDKCLIEINKRKGDSIYFTHLLCELVHSFPSEFGLEPYAEDIAMPVAPEELPHMPEVEEFDAPVAFTQESLENLASLLESRYLEPQKEALLVLARLTKSEENQNLLSNHENLLTCLRQSLDKSNHDSIQRLSLEVWKNLFQNVDHRRHATKEFIVSVGDLLECTDFNEIKFLILSCLERIANSDPSLVFDNTSVDLFEKHRGAEDERIRGLCQDILDLQIVV